MKKVLFLAVLAALLVTAVSAYAYKNPVVNATGDPHCIRDGGWFWLYSEIQVSGGGNVKCWKSKDLVNWTYVGVAFSNAGEAGVQGLWGPSVHKIDGKFYLYYSNWMGGNHADLCVATGTTPTSFSNRKIMIDNSTGESIDPFVYTDRDGKLYMYFKRYVVNNPSEIRVRPMSGPKAFSAAGSVLFNSNNVPGADGIVEQPHMDWRNGHYVLFFSYDHGATTGYKIGYAKGSSAKGPFTISSRNPIMYTGQTSGVIAPGSSCTVWDASTVRWMVYRQKKNSDYNWDRVICIDRLMINDYGDVTITATRGTSQTNPVPLP